MDLIKYYRDNRIISFSNDQKQLFQKLNDINDKLIKYKRRRKKISQERKKIDALIVESEKLCNELTIKIKFDKFSLKPFVSIGYDKRSSTYNCIYEINGSKHCFYIGSKTKIRKALEPFQKEDIQLTAFKKLKLQLINIIRIVLTDLSESQSHKEGIKINFQTLIEHYLESGKWTYWRLVK
mgnify:FL=1